MDEVKNKSLEFWNREELRGIFVLGIIATLISARSYYEQTKIPLGFISVEAFFFADIILLMWGIYAFFMAISYSGDFLPDTICNTLSYIGRIFFILGVFFTGYLSFIFFIFGFINKLWIIVYPLIPFFIYKFPDYIEYIHKKIQFDRSSVSVSDVLRKLSGMSYLLLYVFSLVSIVTDYFFEDRDLPIITFMSICFGTICILLKREKDRLAKIEK